jgi:hypothetical protein
LGQCLKFIHQSNQLFVEPNPIANKQDPSSKLVQRLGLLADVASKKTHQARDLYLRSFPVLGRKRENCQVLDANIRAGFHNFSDTPRSCMVPKKAGPTTLCGPTTISIHNNGDMTWASM